MGVPSVNVESETSVRVSWNAPLTPNGAITGYYIYLNTDRVPTNMLTAGSYVISNLQPYTVYSIQVREGLNVIYNLQPFKLSMVPELTMSVCPSVNNSLCFNKLISSAQVKVLYT